VSNKWVWKMSIVGWMMCLEMTRFVITIQQVYITRFAWKRNIRVYLFQVRKELLCESERSYSWPLDKKQWLWLNHSLSDSRDLFFSSFSLFMCLFISSSYNIYSPHFSSSLQHLFICYVLSCSQSDKHNQLFSCSQGDKT
jgi:hypothetical protein